MKDTSAHDVPVGGAAALVGAAVFLSARSFPRLEDGIPGPGLFPQAVGILMIITGIGLLVHGWRTASWLGLRRLRAALTGRPAAGILVVAAAGAAYAGLLPYLGFRLSAWLAALLVMLRMGVSPWRSLPAAALLTLLVYAVYAKLKVPLPVGVLGW
ncbi:MAG: tripartite tricarboxylate transporter TctB family protein [Armatimonadetes bacterium]|nr:tripartite tricarboxylate transporter TctB family protein [Armatimonadota bacterium]